MTTDRTENRIRNSRKNLIFASCGQLIITVFSFLERRVFLSFLSVDYLGINGLYTSLLSFLSVAELGIGSAIIYCLYKPIAENNYDQIAALMHVFKKIYAIIGFIVIGLGICCIPFLDVIIDSDLSSLKLSLYFIIFLANSVIGYFFSFKIYFIELNQKKYITTYAAVTAQMVQYVLQMATVALFRNYYIYLLVALIVNFGRHIYLARKADKLYPYINKKTKTKIPQEVKSRIIKNSKGAFLNKIADSIVTSTDSVLITLFVSLSVTGLYSNYQMIIIGTTTTISMVFSSMIASIGNLCATEDEKTIYNSFETFDLACFIIYSTVALVLAICFKPLIGLLFGTRFTLPRSTEILICISFFVTGMRKSVLVYREVMGLFWEDRYKSIIQVAINIIASIFLGKAYGINGIIAGTIISTLLACTWIEPLVIFHKGFYRKVRKYYMTYAIRCIIIILIFIISNSISNMVMTAHVSINLLSSFAITLLSITIVYFIIYFRSKKMKDLINILRMSIKVK